MERNPLQLPQNMNIMYTFDSPTWAGMIAGFFLMMVVACVQSILGRSDLGTTVRLKVTVLVFKVNNLKKSHTLILATYSVWIWNVFWDCISRVPLGMSKSKVWQALKQNAADVVGVCGIFADNFIPKHFTSKVQNVSILTVQKWGSWEGVPT